MRTSEESHTRPEWPFSVSSLSMVVYSGSAHDFNELQINLITQQCQNSRRRQVCITITEFESQSVRLDFEY